jgi:hypothetical protein
VAEIATDLLQIVREEFPYEIDDQRFAKIEIPLGRAVQRRERLRAHEIDYAGHRSDLNI